MLVQVKHIRFGVLTKFLLQEGEGRVVQYRGGQRTQ